MSRPLGAGAGALEAASPRRWLRAAGGGGGGGSERRAPAPPPPPPPLGTRHQARPPGEGGGTCLRRAAKGERPPQAASASASCLRRLRAGRPQAATPALPAASWPGPGACGRRSQWERGAGLGAGPAGRWSQWERGDGWGRGWRGSSALAPPRPPRLLPLFGSSSVDLPGGIALFPANASVGVEPLRWPRRDEDTVLPSRPRGGPPPSPHPTPRLSARASLRGAPETENAAAPEPRVHECVKGGEEPAQATSKGVNKVVFSERRVVCSRSQLEPPLHHSVPSWEAWDVAGA